MKIPGDELQRHNLFSNVRLERICYSHVKYYLLYLTINNSETTNSQFG